MLDDNVNLKNESKICSQSKITGLFFNKVSEKVRKRPLEVVCSDVCCPIIPTISDNN